MAKSKLTYAKLKQLGKEYNVSNNALFVAASEQYLLQQEIIENIRNSVVNAGNEDLTVTNKYGGNANIYANPLIRELTKHCDSANRTLQCMLDIIVKLGYKEEAKDTSLLAELMRDG